jgi:hypothetical protein
MFKRLALALCLVALVLPSTALADASVVQEYCEQVTEGSNDLIRIWFSVANFSLPAEVCALSIVPEPQPVDPGCEMVDVGAPVGWSVFLNPLGGADWFANTIGNCIAPGSLQGDFSFVVSDPQFCCYVVQFMDATGAVMLEQEECFNCTIVGAEESSWGTIKALFD